MPASSDRKLRMRLSLGAAVAIGLLSLAPASASAQSAWTKADAQELVSTVDTIGEEGLDPADYPVAPLRKSIASDDPAGWSSAATTVFVHLATDLANGHTQDRNRLTWHIAGTRLSSTVAQAMLERALATHTIHSSLMALEPQTRQFRLLKAALATTPAYDKAGIERLRANMERWRWMPRDLGSRYLFVNVPAFTVSLIENGHVVERHRVIVGKRSTPTPQFSATVTGVILNPWWEVPASIVRESVGRLLRTRPAVARARGYVTSGGRVRQAPGPNNALGQMKLVMPNPYTVYLHDTPSKQLFEQDMRAFSHGCIRVQDPLDLDVALLAGTPGWDRAHIDEVVASRRTTEVRLDRPLPVYVAYFTAAADDDGAIATFPDVYGRDGPVVASLVDRQTDTLPAP